MIKMDLATLVENCYIKVVIYITISVLLLSCSIHKVHGQTMNNSCKMLSNNDTTILCEDILKNSTLYHYQGNLNDSLYLSNISSLRIQSPCLNLIKHHLCYYYHPVCDLDSGDVIEPCNSNCEQLNSDPTCTDLIHNVTRELESVGLTFPNIKCLKAEAANSVATMPCLDIVNGNVSTPVTDAEEPSYTTECIPIPEDNACFSQLSHTYFAPNVFTNTEEFQREFRTVIAPLPANDPCRGFFGSLSCVLIFPSCNNSTKKLQPLCPEICSTIDTLVSNCIHAINFSTIPTLRSVFGQYNCSDPTTYFVVPIEYIDTNSCSSFIRINPNELPDRKSDGDSASLSSSSSSEFPFGLSKTIFIIAVVSSGVVILLICAVVSICITICIRKKRKKKNIIRDTVVNSIEVAIPSQYQYLNQSQYMNKDVTSDDGVSRLLNQVKIQFSDCLIPVTSLSKNMIIGKGEFGVVYRGHLINDEDNTTQTVAIKTVRSLERWLSEAADFMSESTIMAYFDHPNVLRMIGLCVDAETFSIDIVLPYMANGDLRAFLKEHRVEQGNISVYPEGLNEMALIKLCMDVAKGMEYLASNRFVHRDLAARNCMVDEKLCVKVADFGLAKDIYSSEYYRMSSHTRVPVKWMSPESLLDGFFNEKTDVWSYGVTCWEVFSLGRLPYAGIDNQQMIRTLKNGYRLEKPELCSDTMYDSVIALCWEEAPINRLSFKDIVQTLDHILTDANICT